MGAYLLPSEWTWTALSGTTMYEHDPRAANRGDVWKHFLLLTVLDLLLETKEKDGEQFLYLESHCGPPFHVLGEKGAWREGWGRVIPPPSSLAGHPYFRFLGSKVAPGALYLGSWLQVAFHLERVGRDFRMSLLDNSERVARKILGLGISAQPSSQISFQMGDGFEALRCTEGWDLVLVDPPFWPDPREDVARCRETVAVLRGRSSVFLIWYPLRSRRDTGLGRGLRCEALEVLWGDRGGGSSMVGCGVLMGGLPRSVLECRAEWLHALASHMGWEFRWRAAGG